MNNQYLNEEKYQKTNNGVKKTGKLLLIIGAILLVTGVLLILLGILSFGGMITTNAAEIEQGAKGAFGGFALFTLGGFVDMIGFTLTSIGGILTFIGHRREISAYTAQQSIPVTKEVISEMTPTVANSAKEIAKGIKEGLNEANEEDK